MNITTKQAFEVIKQAMIDDSPSAKGGYAHAWHCNIAMMCSDAMQSHKDITIDTSTALHEASNDAASRFMKLCFDVDTSG